MKLNNYVLKISQVSHDTVESASSQLDSPFYTGQGVRKNKFFNTQAYEFK